MEVQTQAGLGTIYTITPAIGGVNAIAFDAFVFDAGETISVRFSRTATVATDDPVAEIVFNSSSPGLNLTNAVGTLGAAIGSQLELSVTAPISAASGILLRMNNGAPGNGNADIVFLGCSDGTASGPNSAASEAEMRATARDAQAKAAAEAVIRQTARLTLNRTRSQITRPEAPEGGDAGTEPPSPVAGGRAPLASAGRGAASQAPDTPYGVWADFTWTALQDENAVVDLHTDAFAGAAGVDTQTAGGLIYGAAFSIARAVSDRQSDDFESTERSVGVSPYLAYQLSDRYAVQALIGYGYAMGEVRGAGEDGDYDAHRYYVAVEASIFETWGDLSLYGGVGLLWGRAHRLSYTERDGDLVRGARFDVGTVSVIAQPSYIFGLEEWGFEEAFIEPFILFELAYDFALTEIAGAANDRDALRLGVGTNAYIADGVSASVEATRLFGRAKQSETSARATVRFDF